MSILIKDMKMPKPKLTDMATVYHAYVLVRPNGHAAIVVDNEDGLDSTEYPLFPVPPHGRLGDLDALAAQCDDPYWCVWLSDIEAAPTIIPEEEVEA